MEQKPRKPRPKTKKVRIHLLMNRLYGIIKGTGLAASNWRN